MPAGVIKVFENDVKSGGKHIFTAHSNAKTMAGWTDFPSELLFEQVFLSFHDLETDKKMKGEGMVLDIETVWRDGAPIVSVYIHADKIRLY